MRRIAVPERGAEALFGTHDENLRFLEDTLKVRIRSHGSELIVEGQDAGVEAVAQIFDQLGGLMKDGYAVAAGDVRLAAQLLSQDGGVRLRDFLMKAAVHQPRQNRPCASSATESKSKYSIEVGACRNSVAYKQLKRSRKSGSKLTVSTCKRLAIVTTRRTTAPNVSATSPGR